MRLKLLAIALMVSVLGGVFQSSIEAQPNTPVYARQRAAIAGVNTRDGNYRPPVRPPFDQANFGFFPYQPAIAGNWYARPYPYHFDYYRWRYSAAVECPCADAALSD